MLLDGARQPSMRSQESVLVFPELMSASAAIKSSTGKGEMVQGMRLAVVCSLYFLRHRLSPILSDFLASRRVWMLQVNLLLFLRFGGFRTIGERLLRIGLDKPKLPQFLVVPKHTIVRVEQFSQHDLKKFFLNPALINAFLPFEDNFERLLQFVRGFAIDSQSLQTRVYPFKLTH